jgi:hypothetical protein
VKDASDSQRNAAQRAEDANGGNRESEPAREGATAGEGAGSTDVSAKRQTSHEKDDTFNRSHHDSPAHESTRSDLAGHTPSAA